ncbi:T9SS type A sorting domain-containing protein [Crocinitomix catalasitica]|nr:T9SS type A sorting domain-containing protein [Crocinitomix catalasitica]
MVIDDFDNIYLSGWFSETMDFDPGAATFNLTSAGQADAFFLKLDSDGNFLWAERFGGPGWEGGNDVEFNAAGNVLMGGSFEGIVDFDPGAGVVNLDSAIAGGGFTVKLDSDGNFITASNFDIDAIDGDDNMYASFYFTGTFDFDTGPGTAILTSAGSRDIYVLKLDPGGNFLWVKQIGGTEANESRMLDIDGDGNLILTSVFEGTVDFDPNAGLDLKTSQGQEDLVVQKLDTAGNSIWAKAFGGGGVESITGLDIDDLGNIYTTGKFEMTVDFDPGPGSEILSDVLGSGDIFFQKLTTDGEYEWAYGLGSWAFDTGIGVHVDAAGYFYGTGLFFEWVDFDPGPGATILGSNGIADIYIFKWKQSLSGFPNDTENQAVISLFPNPMTNMTELYFELKDTEPYTLTLSDAQGKLLRTIPNLNSGSVQIERANLTSGIYFIQLNSKSGISLSRKLIIE